MVTCKVCGGNCDNGELVGGVCPDCTEEEKQREIRAATVYNLLNREPYQIELRLEGMKNGK